MSIENQLFYNKLTLTVKKKTKRIIELKAKKDFTGNYDALLLVLFALALIHIIFNYENYIILFPVNIIVKPFINLSNTIGWQVAVNKNLNLLTIAFYYLILAVAIVLGILLPRIAKSRKQATCAYEALRKDIMKQLDTSFCSCGSSNCNCKDLYIDYMDKQENIDLIF